MVLANAKKSDRLSVRASDFPMESDDQREAEFPRNGKFLGLKAAIAGLEVQGEFLTRLRRESVRFELGACLSRGAESGQSMYSREIDAVSRVGDMAERADAERDSAARRNSFSRRVPRLLPE